MILQKTTLTRQLLIISNITIVSSVISLYSYVLIFFLKFDRLSPLDPKDLNIIAIHEIILFFLILSMALSVLIFFTVIIDFAIKIFRKNHIPNSKLSIFSISISIAFLLIFYLDAGNILFWFFD